MRVVFWEIEARKQIRRLNGLKRVRKKATISFVQVFSYINSETKKRKGLL